MVVDVYVTVFIHFFGGYIFLKLVLHHSLIYFFFRFASLANVMFFFVREQIVKYLSIKQVDSVVRGLTIFSISRFKNNNN